jgi:hypothetical protein
MSRENVELTYQAIDAFNRRDLDAVLTLIDADVEFGSLLAGIEGRYRGDDGIRRWWENVVAVFPDFSVELVEVRDIGEFVVAAVRFCAHGAGSDAPVEQMQWHVARWRDKKTFWWKVYDTRAEALEAAGLSEQDAHADS